eukprot:Gregarina_sp_Poly_1__6520@NODE_3497_length_1053_cov_101_229209_g2217_i0_p1_GENE_NODE_3497_length_1053_cov_101_229209_g2217_i0NODE_3497_length_1053_cov_101_229209_g2217_i0_p1_ORF_typecomplete_len225_score27_81_NODE_3497_length_1053_cov_101_229209_g2217_i0316990
MKLHPLAVSVFWAVVVNSYSVAEIDCGSAPSNFCLEACLSSGCGKWSFTTHHEALECLPKECQFHFVRLKTWAFPVCADEGKGIYAINVLNTLDLSEALDQIHNDGQAAWLSIVTEERDVTEHDGGPHIAAIAMADENIVTTESTQCSLPELIDQKHVAMTDHWRPRLNIESFSLKPLLNLNSSLFFRIGEHSKTLLVQPELKRFVAVQNVSSVGVGAVELMVA